MTAVTIHDIDERLRHLTPEKLAVVYDFVSYLLERDLAQMLVEGDGATGHPMHASEFVLRREWELPEEDEAWAHL